MKTALALSPHLDDAAFSAGATLARLAARGWRVVIATFFTGNVASPEGFALACQLDKGVPPEADYMALRRAEDRVACGAMGAVAVHLPLLEAPHRGYDDAPALFSGIREDDDAVIRVRSLLGPLLAEIQPSLIFAPRCLGGHVDHLVVRQALETVDHPFTLYWTDWPYASRPAPQDPYERQDAGRRTVSVRAAPYLLAKLRACSAYETQIGYQFGGEAGLRASMASVTAERFGLAERTR